jgi:3-oxoadipate enol-lactonase
MVRAVTTDDGCRLSMAVEGIETGSALLLSNSLGTDRRLWDRQMPRFAASHHVFRYDMRGHGASDAPAGDYTIERLGRDVLAIMDASGLARASLAGVSIGGLVSLWIATHAPHRVESLVLANTAARIGNDDLWRERIRLVRTDGMAALADATMARWFTAAFREREQQTVDMFREMVASTPVDGYAGCCAALRDADLRPLAVRVGARTLVISGAHDVATSPADGRWLAASIPHATYVELESAHLSNVERAEEFTEAIVGAGRGLGIGD